MVHQIQIKNTFLELYPIPDKTSYQTLKDVTYFSQKANSSRCLVSASQHHGEFGNLFSNKGVSPST